MDFERKNLLVPSKLGDEKCCKQDQHEAEPDPFLVTVSQTEKLLNVGKTTVFDLINKGRLERRKVGNATRITLRSVRNVAGI